MGSSRSIVCAVLVHNRCLSVLCNTQSNNLSVLLHCQSLCVLSDDKDPFPKHITNSVQPISKPWDSSYSQHNLLCILFSYHQQNNTMKKNKLEQPKNGMETNPKAPSSGRLPPDTSRKLSQISLRPYGKSARVGFIRLSSALSDNHPNRT